MKLVLIALVTLALVGAASAASPAKTPREAVKRTRACLVKSRTVTRFERADAGRGLIAHFRGKRGNPWRHPWASVSYSSAGSYGVIAAKTTSGDLGVRLRRIWNRCTDVVD